jgi:Na+/phosphate symporter
MMIAVWPLVVALVGALVYFIASNTKVVEIGRLTFFVGLFWLVYSLVGKTLHLG